MTRKSKECRSWKKKSLFQQSYLDFFLKRLLIFDGFLFRSPFWYRSCETLLIWETGEGSCPARLSLLVEEHEVCRGLGIGAVLESWFMLQDFSRMPLYTLLAGLKIILLVSVSPTQSGEPLEISAVSEEESPVEDCSKETSSWDVFWGDRGW